MIRWRHVVSLPPTPGNNKPSGRTLVGATPIDWQRRKTHDRRNFKRVALISDNSDLGQLLAKFFRAGLEKLGIQVGIEEVVPRGATSAEPQMQKIRAANVEALFMAGVLTPENVLALKAYRQLGLKIPILASYNLSVPQYMTAGRGVLDGVTFVDAFDPDKLEVKRFMAAYKKKHGVDPYNMHAYGYDGIYMIADAIRRAGSPDKEKIRQAMQSTHGWSGVLGAKGAAYGFPEGKRTGFDPQGMVVRIYEKDNQGRVLHVGAK